MAARNHKILFSGPVGAGKSTAVRTLSDIRPLLTDEVATDETAERKRLTTVAMDYGLLHLEGGEQVHLYGTPGQDRFDFMWEILQEGALGLVILVDNAARDPLASLDLFLEAYRPFIADTGVAIGVTRTDIDPVPTLEEYRRRLDRWGIRAPVFTVDARVRSDMVLLVEALILSLEPEAVS